MDAHRKTIRGQQLSLRDMAAYCWGVPRNMDEYLRASANLERTLRIQSRVLKSRELIDRSSFYLLKNHQLRQENENGARLESLADTMRGWERQLRSVTGPGEREDSRGGTQSGIDVTESGKICMPLKKKKQTHRIPNRKVTRVTLCDAVAALSPIKLLIPLEVHS